MKNWEKVKGNVRMKYLRKAKMACKVLQITKNMEKTRENHYKFRPQCSGRYLEDENRTFEVLLVLKKQEKLGLNARASTEEEKMTILRYFIQKFCG